MFKVGDRVCYSNEDYDQDEAGIVEEIIYKIDDLGDEQSVAMLFIGRLQIFA